MHPILFWMGLGAIAIPILIYLINRRRFRIVDWAAMSFLLAALRRTRKRLRIEELILLALRCLILLLFGAALARFAGCGSRDAFSVGNDGRTIVIVLDDSYSMGQAQGGREAFAKACEDIKLIIEKLTGSDRLGILLTSRPGSKECFFPLAEVTDPKSLIGRVEALRPSGMRTNMLEALESAEVFLKNIDGEKNLFMLSDFRQVDLDTPGQAGLLADRVKQLQNQGVKVIAMDFGLAGQKNLTVEKIALASRYASAGQPVRISLAVRNNGQSLLGNVPVEMSAIFSEGETLRTVALPTRMIESLEPGQVWQTEVPFTPASAGFAVIGVKLPADDLPGDNEAFLSLDVRAAARVLLVDGKPNAAVPEDAESFFVALVLNPNGNGSHGFEVERITRDKLNSVDFKDYDLVMLLNLPNFPLKPTETANKKIENYPAVAALEQYVSDGGGLIIFTGDQIDTDFYNTRLYNKGSGLSPLLIRQPVGDAKSRKDFFKIDPTGISPTGIMRFFSGSGGALTELIRFFAFTPADDNVLPAGDGTALPVIEARFNDRSQSPAVVSRKLGDGRVVMFYSTASLSWNDWAMDSVGDVQGLFVLFIADLAEDLARRQKDVFTGPVGNAINYTVSADLRDATATLILPLAEADLVNLTPQSSPAGPQVRYDQVYDVGIYRISLRSPNQRVKEIFFARNPGPVEGRLDHASEQDISSLFDNQDFRYIDRTGTGLANLDKAVADKQHWVWLVAAVLVLLTLEMYLAMRFGHWK